MMKKRTMMTKKTNHKNNSIKICLAIIGGAVLLLLLLVPLLGKQQLSDCTSSQKYNSSTERCRDKTETEIKEEEEARQAELKRQEKLREETEIARKKQSGEVCLSAAESWDNIGKNTCVAFHPDYFYSTGYGRMFINEQQDYRNGFVAPLMYNYMISWDNLLASYRVSMVAVSGTIERYEGHPEIKVYNLNQITIPTLVSCDTSYGCVYRR
jgi:hypothetical protein